MNRAVMRRLQDVVVEHICIVLVPLPQTLPYENLSITSREKQTCIIRATGSDMHPQDNTRTIFSECIFGLLVILSRKRSEQIRTERTVGLAIDHRHQLPAINSSLVQ